MLVPEGNRIHLKTLFECERRVLIETIDRSCDKAYPMIRCEAKRLIGTSGTSCNRKEALG